MAAVRGVDDLLPTAVLAVALATLAEVQRRDVLEDEMEEPGMRSSHAARGRSETPACSSGWAQLLEDEDLCDPPNSTAKQFRTDFCLPYPFFLELVKLVTPYHQTSPEKTQKLYIRSDGRYEG